MLVNMVYGWMIRVFRTEVGPAASCMNTCNEVQQAVHMYLDVRWVGV